MRSSPDRSTKSTRLHAYGAPTACRRGVSGSLSLPSRGSFHLSFTVLCSIGHQRVFSLAGWSPPLPTGFLVSRGTPDPAAPSGLRLRGSHPLRQAFPGPFGCPHGRFVQSIPRRARTAVWAPPVSLAATPGIDFSFFSSGYLDVSVRRVPPACLWIQHTVAEVFSAGFPHSDTCGSQPICGSPQLFAACRVFHRPLVPRHPPRALFCLTGSFFCCFTLSRLAWRCSGSAFRRFQFPGTLLYPHSAVLSASCGFCPAVQRHFSMPFRYCFLGCFVLSRFSQTQDTYGYSVPSGLSAFRFSYP